MSLSGEDFICPITNDWLTDDYRIHPIYMAQDGHYYSGAIKEWFRMQQGSSTVKSPKTGLPMGWELFENPQPITRLFIEYIKENNIIVDPIPDKIWKSWTKPTNDEEMEDDITFHELMDDHYDNMRELNENYITRMRDQHYAKYRLVKLLPIKDLPSTCNIALEFDVKRSSHVPYEVDKIDMSQQNLIYEVVENGIHRQLYDDNLTMDRYTVLMYKNSYCSFKIPKTIGKLFINREIYTMVNSHMSDVEIMLKACPGIVGKIKKITNQNKIQVIERFNALAHLEPTELMPSFAVVNSHYYLNF